MNETKPPCRMSEAPHRVGETVKVNVALALGGWKVDVADIKVREMRLEIWRSSREGVGDWTEGTEWC